MIQPFFRCSQSCTKTVSLHSLMHYRYVTYFMRQIEMFKFFGVKPYVVFDGGYLPSKAATEDDRLRYFPRRVLGYLRIQ